MEISDYLRLVARRSRVVIAAVIIAVLLATLLFFLQPPVYAAKATVVVPTPNTSSSLIASVSQSVSDFLAAISTDQVAERAASEVGISPDEVASGLEPIRVSDSGVVQVRFTHGDPDIAEDAVVAVTSEALILLLRSRLEPFEAQLEFARDRADAVQDDLLEFQTRTGYLEPARVFQEEDSEMQDLRNQIGAALTDGDEERAAELQARLDAKAAKLIPEQSEYETLVAAQLRAQEALAAAEIANDSAASSLQSVEGGAGSQGSAISSTDASKLSRRQRFLAIVIPTVLIATLLATVLVVLLEVVPARPSSRWAQLKRRLPPDDPSGAAISLLQAKAARRRRSEVPGGPASTHASGGSPPADPEMPAPPATQPVALGKGEPEPRGTVARPDAPLPGARAADGSKRQRLRLDPVEEALAVEERRAAREAMAAQEARETAAVEATQEGEVAEEATAADRARTAQQVEPSERDDEPSKDEPGESKSRPPQRSEEFDSRRLS